MLYSVVFFFFFKQKTAYEMRISDWSSDVCSSDLVDILEHAGTDETGLAAQQFLGDAGPDQQRPRRVRADHPVLHRQRRDDVHRLPAIVPFAMPRRTIDHRLAPRDRKSTRLNSSHSCASRMPSSA